MRVTLIFIDHKDNHDAVLIMGVITNIAVAISIASAFPWVRNTHHKYVCTSDNLLREYSRSVASSSATIVSSDGEYIILNSVVQALGVLIPVTRQAWPSLK